MPNQTAKNWVFTLNNFTEKEHDDIFTSAECTDTNIIYVIVGKETGEKGTPHLQGFVSFTKRRSLKQVKVIVGDRAHVEAARGTNQQAADYCKKDGAYREHGTCPKGQGSRSDLEAVYALVKTGTPTKQIAEIHPGTTIRYFNGIKRLQQLFRPKRDKPPQIHVFWGETGTGKTRRVWEFANLDEFWVHPGDRWFDGYDGQSSVLFDDFDGSWFKLSYLLRLLDRYTMPVPVKGAFAWWTPEHIYITSNVQPKEWYRQGNEAHVRALKRRLKEFGTIVHTITDKSGTKTMSPKPVTE